MEDVFGNQEGPQQGEAVQQPVEQHDEQQEGNAAPPVADTNGQVPLKALEAERTKRREYRDKWNESQGEIRALREQIASRGSQTNSDTQQRQSDPLQQAIAAAQNERLETSEMLAREKFGNEAVDKAFEKFQDAIRRDPTLYQKVMGQKHPWAAVVTEMQRADLLAEIGDDPAAYKERLRAELLASTSDPVKKPPLPTSLATARSSAARTAPGFTGPPPLKDVFG